ncbi:MAG: preprotein translocase subunit SecY [Clostridiales bacterium]|jgi:preprotein translocase subunit SecY|nr:preprotein translocase subunit SecY [Clostridiales bacterium]
MFEVAKNAWKFPEVKKKVWCTIVLLVIFRFCSYIPVPLVDTGILKSFLSLGQGNTVFSLMDLFSGGAFSNATIFAMGISPYINASIIVQLLSVAIPALERLQKDSINGRKKIFQLQRFVTILLAFIQGIGIYYLLKTYGIVVKTEFLNIVTIVISFCAGTAFLMWLGERITEKGIGNGVSLIIFSGIVSRMPSMAGVLYNFVKDSKNKAIAITNVNLILLASILVTTFVVLMNEAERRILVKYAKRIVGRKMYEGQNAHIPIKISSAGVTPIIFAMSIMLFPSTISQLFGVNLKKESFWCKLLKVLSPNSWFYGIVYFFLIVFFTYFYASIQFNPIEISNNMKKSGGFIPGIRPGHSTSDYISKVLSKITLIGATFLGFIAVLPIFLNKKISINGFNVGGTSLLIVVGVALETVRYLESQMIIKTHKGFLE